MFSVTRVLLAAGASLLPLLASAQLITDPTRATAARDSVLQQASALRLQLEQQTKKPTIKAPFKGVRRVVTRGYRVRANRQDPTTATSHVQLVWKCVTRVRRTGSTVEKFKGYADGRLALREVRVDGQVRYLEVQTFRLLPAVQGPTPSYRSLLTANGLVLWRQDYYQLPATAPTAR